VRPIGWLAATVLLVQLPIPLFWFVMHPQINHWRNHRSAGYATALLLAWVPITLFLVIFRRELFLHAWPAMRSAIVGFALLFFEAWIFWRVKRDLGASRLVGRTELSGGGELVRQGIYARIRHMLGLFSQFSAHAFWPGCGLCGPSPASGRCSPW
jgi:protein-S-isoprenylcysteine O-methyltransferase Ste14